MAGTFDILRANDLIFSYVVSNWLMGQDPPAFDILAWNADSTRMPAATHSFYLRNFYVENRLGRHNGSWWEDWAIWSAENSGPLVNPPPTGNSKYRVICDGPGDYIHT